MRANEFLIESRGLFGRNTGDVFVDDNSNEAQFQSIDIMPSNQAGATYDSEEQMLQDLEKLIGNNSSAQVNARNSGSKSFAVATLKHPDGSEEKWIKWFAKVPSNLLGAWPNKEVPKEGPKWALRTKTAAKARSGLTPQDLIKSDDPHQGIAAIVNKVASNLSEDIKEGLSDIANGKLPATFPNQKENLTSIRDHLGEIIQPLALKSGIIKGDADKAAQEILKAPYDKCKVVWPQSKNTGLIDSYFIGPEGNILGVSSKGDKGANASVSNIRDAIAKAPNNLRRKHATAIDIIETIATYSQKQGPAALAYKLGLIDEQQMQETMNYVNNPSTSVPAMDPGLRRFMDLISADTAKVGYSVGYQLLAGLAKAVCERVNSDPKFSAACVEFLNQSSIIQIYTDAKAVGNDVQITNFRSVYPPNFSGSVVLTSAKTYYSTGIKGKFTFDYRKK